MADYDIIIIGSGPGGYVAAIRAAQLGYRTAIVEREHLAGICSNWGCIPTKALLRSAEILHYGQHAKDYGLVLEGSFKADLEAVVKRSRGIAARMNNGVQFLMKKNKVDVIWGEAVLTRPGTIQVAPTKKPAMQPQVPPPKNAKGEGTYTAKHIIVATGARPRALPGIEPDGKLIWTYFEAMVPAKLPKSLLVMGSGAIGIEFASFYRTMGVEVTVVEVMPQVVPVEDAEIGAFARKAFEKQGIKILTSAKVTKVEKGADSITAHIEDEKGGKQTITADRMISAVGVVGNIENLGLEALGVKTDRGFIVIDGYGKTNVPGIYAIGDVVRGPMLAHKAEDEGVAVAEIIAGKHGHVNYDAIPGIVYTSPEVASLGKTEEELKAAGVDYKVGKFPFTANGRARAMRQTDGFVKVLADAKTDRVLGCHIIGPRAGDLIAEVTVLMEFGGSSEDLARTCHAHPTLAETVKEAAMAVEKRQIHM